jgi:chromosomal replication initiation ATPase DnaA
VQHTRSCPCRTCRLERENEALREENVRLLVKVREMERILYPHPDAVVEQVTLARIKSAVASEFDVHTRLLSMANRTPPVVRARRVAFYLCRGLLKASLPQIGQWFDRDHSTVLHGLNDLAEELSTDEELRARIVRICSTLQVDGLQLLDSKEDDNA